MAQMLIIFNVLTSRKCYLRFHTCNDGFAKKNERILEVGKLKLHTNCINNELNCYGIMNFTR